MEAPFPKFIGRRPEKKDNWTWGPTSKQKKWLATIEEALRKRLQEGLNGLRVFDTFVRRPIASLGERAWPMWESSRPLDPDCVSPEEFSGSEVIGRLDQLQLG